MSTLEALQTRIQKRIAETRARLSESFASFDRHKVKKVTFSQAVRALNTFCKLDLNPAEVEALRVYNTADGLFKYKDFCDDIDTIFTVKGLERAPDTIPRNPLGGSRLRGFGSKLNEVEEEDYHAVMDACQEAVATRGVLVKAFFSDFDKHNCGFVSRPQFEREIRSCFSFLNEDDIDMLAKYYGDGKDVNYRQLHWDVTPDAIAPGRTAAAGGPPARRRMHGGSGSAVDVDALEARIIRQVATRRIRTKDFFVEYDSLRSGHITATQFQRALYSCKFADVSDAEYKALAAKYFNDARGKVRYVDFLDTLDEAFTIKGLEKAPSASLDTMARTIAKAPRRTAPRMSSEEAALLDQTMADIARVIAERRIELVPLFKDFDRSNEEYVSKDQFIRVLRGESLLPGSSAAIAVLVNRFIGSGDRAGRVDWRTFYNIVDPKPAAVQLVEVTRRTIKNPPSDVGQVMHRIKSAVVRDKIRVEEFLRDHDKLRKGFITKHQLETSLSATGLKLTFEDVDALASAYEDPRALDPQGQPMVAWRRMCDDVNLVTTCPGLELNPAADIDATTTMARTGTLGLPSASTLHADPRPDVVGGSRLSPRSEERLRELLQDLESICTTRRLELIPAFEDFDRHKRGIISSSQFARAMDRMGLSMDTDDLRLIVQAFQTPSADRSELSYKWFVDAIDSVDGFIGNLPGSNEAPTAAGASMRRTGGVGKFSATVERRKMPSLKGREAAVEEVVERIKLVCATRGLKVKDFFHDYDRLRTGHIHKSKFRTALATAKLELTEEEMRCVEEEYRNVRDATHVNWRELAYEVDGGNEELEKLPTGTVMRRTGRRTLAVVGGPSEEEVDRILSGVAGLVGARRVNLKPRFQDFDPLRHSHIPKNRFCGVLQNEGLVLVPKDLATLCEAFEVVGVSDKVNYSKFLLAVDSSLSQ